MPTVYYHTFSPNININKKTLNLDNTRNVNSEIWQLSLHILHSPSYSFIINGGRTLNIEIIHRALTASIHKWLQWNNHFLWDRPVIFFLCLSLPNQTWNTKIPSLSSVSEIIIPWAPSSMYVYIKFLNTSSRNHKILNDEKFMRILLKYLVITL